MKKKFIIIEMLVICIAWLGLTALSWFHPAQDISVSERRPLQQFPEINAKKILDLSFMSDFESFTLDQFPSRDDFRTLKAFAAYKVFGQKDNNGVYLVNGQAAKLDFPLNTDSNKYAANKIKQLYDNYLSATDANVYFSIVPDKGYYLAAENGYPSMDYEALTKYFYDELDFAQYIDIYKTLSADDYYATDSHWMQESIFNTAQTLANGMGINLTEQYTQITVDTPFYGVYYGQAALPLQPDTLTYLTNNTLEACTVYNVENSTTTGVYNLEELQGNDPYEMFLSGAAAILYLENPNSTSGRELIVFRDSYGSSLIPLFAEAYDKITLVDTRYVAPDFLKNFVDFEAADDVLFMYSTSLLNSSSTLK